jgi:predicted esterase YcpF (UPF0227 family)
MKKVLYLHGLESSNSCEKVQFLERQCVALAPAIDYRRDDIEEFLFDIVESFHPDLIVGSSMGGYVGLMLANYYGVNVIAFNPAIHSRSIEPKLDRLEAKQVNINVQPIIVLGLQDTVVDPKETVNLIDNSELEVTYEMYTYLGHRITIDVFVDIYNKYIK